MSSATHTNAASRSAKVESWRMFDRIAPRYDLLNHLLSFRRDVAWRRKLYRRLPPGDALMVLDLACGTGDVLSGLLTNGENVERGMGIDLSSEMLKLGREKLRRQGLGNRSLFVRSDAMRAAVMDETFDAATIAFGIRNVPNWRATLQDIHRVLKPGGRALVLEFSLPRSAMIRIPYLLYFRHVLPLVGGWVSGDRRAYRYLNETVEAFPYGGPFCDEMRAAGFTNVQALPLTWGVATLYQGDKSRGKADGGDAAGVVRAYSAVSDK